MKLCMDVCRVTWARVDVLQCEALDLDDNNSDGNNEVAGTKWAHRPRACSC